MPLYAALFCSVVGWLLVLALAIAQSPIFGVVGLVLSLAWIPVALKEIG